MALEDTFYEKIHSQEKRWIELINQNLLNIYFVKIELKDFYEDKIIKLKNEYSLSNNKMLEQVINEIDCIIKAIDELEIKYNSGEEIDINSLLPLFLINKFTNNFNKIDSLESQIPSIRNQVLAAIKDYKERCLNDAQLTNQFNDDIKSPKK